MDDHVLRALDVLGGVARLGQCDAFAPPLDGLSAADGCEIDPDEQDVTGDLAPEAGPERTDERHLDAAQLDVVDGPGVGVHGVRSDHVVAGTGESDDRSPGGERIGQRGSGRRAPARDLVRCGAPQLDDVGRCRDQDVVPVDVRAVAWRVREGSSQVPCDEQPVRLVTGVDRVGHRAVERRQVGRRLGAEHRDVEPRISTYEGVERPHDRLDAAGERPVALMELHGSPESGPADGGEETGHVAVQRRVPAVDREQSDRGADRLPVASSDRDVAARVGDCDQCLEWKQRTIGPPDPTQDLVDLGEFVGAVEEDDLVRNAHGAERIGRHLNGSSNLVEVIHSIR